MMLVFLLVVFCVCDEFENYKRTDRIVNTVNSMNVGWRAEHNRFSKMSFDEKKKFVGLDLEARKNLDFPAQELNPNAAAPPTTFDSRTQWPKCTTIGNIMDQGHCGSCWAFAGSEVLSDKVCIKTGKDAQLSPQDLVSCDYGDMGCDGGMMENEWYYMKNTGIVPLTCLPYASMNGTVPPCPSKCKDGTTEMKSVKQKAKSYKQVGVLPIERAKAIMTEISENGPVEMGFTVYEDFMQYKDGIYKHAHGDELGGHAVRGIGWGENESNRGGKYWIIANSWGPDWGLNGFFWMNKDRNECGVESSVYTCVPDV